MANNLKKSIGYQKSEAKRWTPIEPAIRLTDALSRLTKDELSAIRARLDIKGASSLKKAELIDKLAETMLQDIAQLLQLFDEKRYSLVKEVAGQDGCSAAGKRSRALVDSICALGIVFTGTVDGKESLVMPAEIVQAVREAADEALQAVVKRNTEWCLLASGMLLYYGALRYRDLTDLLGKHTGKPAELSEVDRVLSFNMHQYGVIKDHNCFASMEAEDSDLILKEHDLRPSIAFYPFTKAQLMRAGEAGFIERNEAFRTFAAYLAAYYEMNREEAVELTDTCVLFIQSGDSLQQMVEFWQDHLELDENGLRMLVDRLVPLMNGTKQWYLKGYAPSELSAKKSVAAKSNVAPLVAPARAAGDTNVFSIQTGKKVGRNEPCPCGSGKKFKKCCGA